MLTRAYIHSPLPLCIRERCGGPSLPLFSLLHLHPFFSILSQAKVREEDRHSPITVHRFQDLDFPRWTLSNPFPLALARRSSIQRWIFPPSLHPPSSLFSLPSSFVSPFTCTHCQTESGGGADTFSLPRHILFPEKYTQSFFLLLWCLCGIEAIQAVKACQTSPEEGMLGMDTVSPCPFGPGQ